MKHQWMPIFWGDFFANTLDLTAQEIGAYLCLIAHAWEHKGLIPAEQKKLYRIARVRSSQWPSVWRSLEKFFEPIPNVTHTQCYMSSRCLIELHKADEISNKRKAAAMHMHSKSRANASVLHMQTTMQNVGNYQGSIDPSFFSTAAHKDGAEKPQQENGSDQQSPRSLATALPTGALARSAQTKDEESKQLADKKRPTETSRQDLEAIFAAKRSASEK